MEELTTCYNMDEERKHDIKWEKLTTKDHTLCDSIYVKHPEQAHPHWRILYWGMPGAEGEEGAIGSD